MGKLVTSWSLSWGGPGDPVVTSALLEEGSLSLSGPLASGATPMALVDEKEGSADVVARVGGGFSCLSLSASCSAFFCFCPLVDGSLVDM